MREIIFRGKAKKTHEWVVGYIVSVAKWREAHIHPYNADSSSVYYCVIPDTVGQYTGLTDKTGAKIFEGDILQYLVRQENIERFVVKFGQYDEYHVGFYAEAISEKDAYRMDLAWWVNVRNAFVVGNVFDNPEMLEVKQ